MGNFEGSPKESRRRVKREKAGSQNPPAGTSKASPKQESPSQAQTRDLDEPRFERRFSLKHAENRERRQKRRNEQRALRSSTRAKKQEVEQTTAGSSKQDTPENKVKWSDSVSQRDISPGSDRVKTVGRSAKLAAEAADADDARAQTGETFENVEPVTLIEVKTEAKTPSGEAEEDTTDKETQEGYDATKFRDTEQGNELDIEVEGGAGADAHSHDVKSNVESEDKLGNESKDTRDLEDEQSSDSSASSLAEDLQRPPLLPLGGISPVVERSSRRPHAFVSMPRAASSSSQFSSTFSPPIAAHSGESARFVSHNAQRLPHVDFLRATGISAQPHGNTAGIMASEFAHIHGRRLLRDPEPFLGPLQNLGRAQSPPFGPRPSHLGFEPLQPPAYYDSNVYNASQSTFPGHTDLRNVTFHARPTPSLVTPQWRQEMAGSQSHEQAGQIRHEVRASDRESSSTVRTAVTGAESASHQRKRRLRGSAAARGQKMRRREKALGDKSTSGTLKRGISEPPLEQKSHPRVPEKASSLPLMDRDRDTSAIYTSLMSNVRTSSLSASPGDSSLSEGIDEPASGAEKVHGKADCGDAHKKPYDDGEETETEMEMEMDIEMDIDEATESETDAELQREAEDRAESDSKADCESGTANQSDQPERHGSNDARSGRKHDKEGGSVQEQKQDKSADALVSSSDDIDLENSSSDSDSILWREGFEPLSYYGAPTPARVPFVPMPPDYGPYYPPPITPIFPGTAADEMQAQLEVDGDLIGITKGWTVDEIKAGRRLVRFHREQHGVKIRLTFEPLNQEDYQSGMSVISCIWRSETQEYFVTSVDCITVLELIMGQKFSVEEKNRTRRNLEACRPLTVSKHKPELEPFFRQIMRYDKPRPRNIEKDLKVFLWTSLETALKKIVSKYSAMPRHNRMPP